LTITPPPLSPPPVSSSVPDSINIDDFINKHGASNDEDFINELINEFHINVDDDNEFSPELMDNLELLNKTLMTDPKHSKSQLIINLFVPMRNFNNIKNNTPITDLKKDYEVLIEFLSKFQDQGRPEFDDNVAISKLMDKLENVGT
jgi:hypothetical protein